MTTVKYRLFNWACYAVTFGWFFLAVCWITAATGHDDLALFGADEALTWAGLALIYLLVAVWLDLPVGTKSLLVGAHCFFIHPWFVALAWWKLYGFPRDPRLWVAFLVHDWGYWGKPNMDGEEGEDHAWLGALLMNRLFDEDRVDRAYGTTWSRCNYISTGQRWFWFTGLHSRFLAQRLGLPFSRLCVADKYSMVLTPIWLYLPLANFSGEIREYMTGKGNRTRASSTNQLFWYWDVTGFLARWVEENRDIPTRFLAPAGLTGKGQPSTHPEL